MYQSSVGHGHGGRRDGAGRPRGALNKITRPVKELAADQGEASICRLIELRDHAKSEQVRFAAAKELLDRACGRPRQEIGEVEDNQIRVFLSPPIPIGTPVHPPFQTLIDTPPQEGSDATD